MPVIGVNVIIVLLLVVIIMRIHTDIKVLMIDTVFQESVNCNIKARNYQELVKSLNGLRDLYALKEVCMNQDF